MARRACVDAGLKITGEVAIPQLLHRRLFIEANPAPAKWALAQMGRIHNEVRLPLVPLSTPCHEPVRAALRAAGLIEHEHGIANA